MTLDPPPIAPLLTAPLNWDLIPLLALLSALTLLLSPTLAFAQQNHPPRPSVWMGPPGYDHGRLLRELFEHPDDWRETRSQIDVLFYTDLQFEKQFTDEELSRWLPKLQEWNLGLGLETGVVKEWSTSGEKTFNIERKIWDRLQRLGGKIQGIAMDEPLLAVREHLHLPDDLALRETANYIALVRRNYPQIQIGDIETYPSIPVADHLWWIDALNKLLAEKHVRGLDFYRLDVNWVVFDVQHQGNWREVRQLEQECRKRHLPFSLIYWAADYPALKNKGLADDLAWYAPLLQQGYAYALVDGAPDQIVVESWLAAPSRALPETADGTFTRSVRDFVQRFAGPKAHP